VAKDLKQNKQARTVSATQMTNSEMDKVTAGAPGLPAPGNAWGRGRGFGFDGHGGAKGQGGTVGQNNPNGRF
jgi:hypothetical protein